MLCLSCSYTAKLMKFFSLLLPACFAISCTSEPAEVSEAPYLMHDVYLDLRDSLSPEEREYILGGLAELSEIPEVLELTIGTRLPTGDSRLDSTFDLALHMAFADVDALLAYQINEDHLAVKKAIAPYLAGAPRVFDYRIQDYQLAVN